MIAVNDSISEGVLHIGSLLKVIYRSTSNQLILRQWIMFHPICSVLQRMLALNLNLC